MTSVIYSMGDYVRRDRFWCLIVLVLLLTCITALAQAQSPVAITNNTIMTNGFFADGEWDSAARAEPGNGVVIYVTQDTRYLYIGIRTHKATHTGLDLYVATSAEKQMLFHVSSAFGEATYGQGEWSEWSWEENRRWTANKIGSYYDDSNNKCYSEPEGFEFQIDKGLINGDIIHVAFHLKRPEHEFPSAKDREAFKNWVQFRIGE